MVVGAAADELDAAGGESRGQRPGVVDDVPAILLELRLERLAEGHSLAGDHMHQRAALRAGKHGTVERLGVFRATHGDAAPRTAEGLMGGAGNEVGDRHGIVVDARGDEPGVVGHVDHQLRAHFAGDLGEPAVRNLAGIRARAGDDQLRLVLPRQARDLVEVEQLVVAADAVVDELVEDARAVELHAVREMAAVGQVEGEHGVARLDGGEVDGRVGLAAGVGLHVDVLRAKDGLEPVAGEVFHRIDEFAAAVIAVAGVALGVFVGEHAADRLHDSGAREVLAGDHLQPFLLPGLFRSDRRPDLGIILCDEVGGAVHGFFSSRVSWRAGSGTVAGRAAAGETLNCGHRRRERQRSNVVATLSAVRRCPAHAAGCADSSKLRQFCGQPVASKDD